MRLIRGLVFVFYQSKAVIFYSILMEVIYNIPLIQHIIFSPTLTSFICTCLRPLPFESKTIRIRNQSIEMFQTDKLILYLCSVMLGKEWAQYLQNILTLFTRQTWADDNQTCSQHFQKMSTFWNWVTVFRIATRNAFK